MEELTHTHASAAVFSRSGLNTLFIIVLSMAEDSIVRVTSREIHAGKIPDEVRKIFDDDLLRNSKWSREIIEHDREHALIRYSFPEFKVEILSLTPDHQIVMDDSIDFDFCFIDKKSHDRIRSVIRAGKSIKNISGQLSVIDTAFDPSGAVITGDARFSGALFMGDARFGDTAFSGRAEFVDAVFSDDAEFGDSIFSGGAWFYGAAFLKEAQFSGAVFSDNAWFYNATFSGDTWFDDAAFSGEARFDGSTFKGDAKFYGAKFSGVALFDHATFSGETRFHGSIFSGFATFNDAAFSGDTVFNYAVFSGVAPFNSKMFSGSASFDMRHYCARHRSKVLNSQAVRR